MKVRCPLLFCLGAMMLGGCGKREETPPSLAELKNATYHGLELTQETVTLKDGVWEGAPDPAEEAMRSIVVLLRDFHMEGDPDRDGVKEAVVLLEENAGGTGHYLYVAVVRREQGKPVNVATALVGDRVQVRDARMTPEGFELDIVRAGPEDALCCPGELATKFWELRGRRLNERAEPRVTGRLSLETLAGASWQLAFWGWDEPLEEGPAPVVRASHEGLTGHGGCRSFTAPVTEGSVPGEITVGPVAPAHGGCGAGQQERERRFFSLLESAGKFGFVGGRLAFHYERPEGMGVMLLERVR
ncbi:MAG: META domain-containing protein [Bacteroidota bacterium]